MPQWWNIFSIWAMITYLVHAYTLACHLYQSRNMKVLSYSAWKCIPVWMLPYKMFELEVWDYIGQIILLARELSVRILLLARELSVRVLLLARELCGNCDSPFNYRLMVFFLFMLWYFQIRAIWENWAHAHIDGLLTEFDELDLNNVLSRKGRITSE